RVSDRTVALLGDGRLRDLPGGVDEYLALRRAQAGDRAGSGTTDGTAGEARPVSDATTARAARKELARIDRQLDRLRDREARLHADLAAAATDHERVMALDASLRELLGEREQLEERWLELAEQAE
ncbi:MAG: ABC transporter C-terminal domain-containing protein, partial [Kineosporiaceae bacterium]